MVKRIVNFKRRRTFYTSELYKSLLHNWNKHVKAKFLFCKFIWLSISIYQVVASSICIFILSHLVILMLLIGYQWWWGWRWWWGCRNWWYWPKKKKSKENGMQFLALHLISFICWKYIWSCLFCFGQKHLHNYIYIKRDAPN